MAKKTWTLTDVERGVHLDTWDVVPQDIPEAAGQFAFRKRVLHGGMSEGVEVIEIDNGRFTFTLLPTRGMSVWRGQLNDGGPVFGWKSPVHGPIHPSLVNLADPSGLGWLDGFDEFLCRCGLESNGAPDFDEASGKMLYPLHGRVGNKPAHKVEVTFDSDSREIVVVGVVDETRFHFQKLRLTATFRTKLGASGFHIHDEVTNLSGNPAEMQMLYHVNFGQPLLDPGSRVEAPIKALVPRDDRAAEDISKWESFGNEQPGYSEQVYFFQLAADKDGLTHTLLRNAHGTQGASLHFNVKQLPCFTLWKNTPAGQDGFVTGIEPGTNYPNPRTYEKAQGRVVPLKAGQKVAFELGVEFHADAAGVDKASREIAKLQAAAGAPNIQPKPVKGWTKAAEPPVKKPA